MLYVGAPLHIVHMDMRWTWQVLMGKTPEMPPFATRGTPKERHRSGLIAAGMPLDAQPANGQMLRVSAALLLQPHLDPTDQSEHLGGGPCVASRTPKCPQQFSSRRSDAHVAASVGACSGPPSHAQRRDSSTVACVRDPGQDTAGRCAQRGCGGRAHVRPSAQAPRLRDLEHGMPGTQPASLGAPAAPLRTSCAVWSPCSYMHCVGQYSPRDEAGAQNSGHAGRCSSESGPITTNSPNLGRIRAAFGQKLTRIRLDTTNFGPKFTAHEERMRVRGTNKMGRLRSAFAKFGRSRPNLGCLGPSLGRD